MEHCLGRPGSWSIDEEEEEGDLDRLHWKDRHSHSYQQHFHKQFLIDDDYDDQPDLTSTNKNHRFYLFDNKDFNF